MDLTDPEALRATISALVADIASSNGMEVSQAGIDRLVAPGLNRTAELRDVDIGRLREALEAVMIQVPATEPPSPAGGYEIGMAMAQSRCHYLWFC